jgi:protein phosphatase
MISDRPDDQSVTPQAFELVRFIGGQRLSIGRLTVIDATNVHKSARDRDVNLAKLYGVPAIAIAFDVPADVCLVRNTRRLSRIVNEQVILDQRKDFEASLPSLSTEGFAAVHTLGPGDLETVSVVREAIR